MGARGLSFCGLFFGGDELGKGWGQVVQKLFYPAQDYLHLLSQVRLRMRVQWPL